jgi:hypothetical protein
VTAVEFDLQPWDAYEALERAGSPQLLDAIDDALDRLEDDPGSKLCRERSFGDVRWGITVRSRTDDLLIIWERDRDREDLIHVRYLGDDPFA